MGVSGTGKVKLEPRGRSGEGAHRAPAQSAPHRHTRTQSCPCAAAMLGLPRGSVPKAPALSQAEPLPCASLGLTSLAV